MRLQLDSIGPYSPILWRRVFNRSVELESQPARDAAEKARKAGILWGADTFDQILSLRPAETPHFDSSKGDIMQI